MVRSKKKRQSDPYAALERLMQEPGEGHEVWDDLLGGTSGDPREQMAKALDQTPKYDDRAAAIVFGAMLEYALERAIASSFATSGEKTNRIFSYGEDGPLATFAAKIAMGYALGIYEEKMRKDLWRIKQIRNVFAHARVRVDFSLEAVRNACEQIEITSILNAKEWKVGYGGRGHRITMTTARKKYTGAVAAINNYLAQYPHRSEWGPAISQLYALMYDTLPPSLRKL